MAKDEFVNNNLVKIREKLATDPEAVDNVQEKISHDEKVEAKASSYRSSENKPSAIANERDWKKAVFRRWDEFKAIKKDLVNRLAERISSIPGEIGELEEHSTELKKSAEKFQKLLDEINVLDDSHWNRHNFTAELGVGMRKLENARIEFMMLSSKRLGKNRATSNSERPSASHSIIHELNSLTFKQCFRIGFAFFMPLILGMLLAALIWGLIYYLSLH